MVSQRTSKEKNGVPAVNVVISLLVSILASHYGGRLARDHLRGQTNLAKVPECIQPPQDEQSLLEGMNSSIHWIIDDKSYSVETEDIKGSIVADEDEDEDDDDEDEEDDDDDEEEDEGEDEDEEDDNDEADKEEDVNGKEMHNTRSTQHLLIDFEMVPDDLIASEDDVERTMETVVDEFDCNMVVHTCIEMASKVINCIGGLDNGHISLQAWPKQRVATLDLMVTDVGLLDSLQTILELFNPGYPKLFAPNATFRNPLQPTKWRIRPRAATNMPDDFRNSLEEEGDDKYMVASLKTDFQQVDIIDFFSDDDRVDWEAFKKDAPKYFEGNQHLLFPDRALFLDGVVQSTHDGMAPYHEALVQPSMFAHPNPRRVAIIGGGECATLREVLKHRTVDEVVMIEIDPGVIEASKQYLPQWTDCSNLEGSSRYCMDDPRAKIYHEDAFRWFMDRYLDNKDEPLFDVIIMDALDPQNVVEFAKDLYGDDSFLKALYKALTKDGILVTQVGDMPDRGNPPDHLSDAYNRMIYDRSLAKHGFQSVADYTEPHAGFESPWYFYAAFKNVSARNNWMANEAEINLKIQKRATRTKDGTSPFKVFDGATMVFYQMPLQFAVEIFCLRQPTPHGCERAVHGFDPNVSNFWVAHGFDPEIPNFGEEFFHVSTSQLGEHAGRGVFAKTDIPRGSFLMLEASVNSVVFEPSSTVLIEQLSKHRIADEYSNNVLSTFARGYGYSPPASGKVDRIQVDSGLMTYANRGCKVDSNIGLFPNITDDTIDPILSHDLNSQPRHGTDHVFNPAVLRDTTLHLGPQNHWRDIRAGEEILESYYKQFSSAATWRGHVEQVRNLCHGDASLVEQYQNEADDESNDEGDNANRNEIKNSFSSAASSAEISSMGDITMTQS